MISIEKCKAVLMQSDEEFTEEEIKKIRDYLYQTINVLNSLLQMINNCNFMP